MLYQIFEPFSENEYRMGCCHALRLLTIKHMTFPIVGSNPARDFGIFLVKKLSS
jgi:hypothetical protein